MRSNRGGWNLMELLIRFSGVVRSDSQWQCRNCLGLDPSILRHSGIWGAANETGLNKVLNKSGKNPPQKIYIYKIYTSGFANFWQEWSVQFFTFYFNSFFLMFSLFAAIFFFTWESAGFSQSKRVPTIFLVTLGSLGWENRKMSNMLNLSHF